MARLPPELWIMIFDLVIEDGIVRLDQCDHNTFPYNHVSISPTQDRYRFYGSYCRLRLVCRIFTTLLGVPPEYDLDASSFPFPIAVRALCIKGSHEPFFRQLLVDTSRCERLVFLKVSSGLTADSTRPNIFDLLSAGESGAFPNVQRLSLRFLDSTCFRRERSFWTRLQRGFAQLVTLSVEDGFGSVHLGAEPDSVATFERLEILFFGDGIRWSGCHFPHLRHASIKRLWGPSTLDTFRSSSHLECLLVRSRCAKFSVDVRSFSRLRVLSLPADRVAQVDPLDCDHPLEHLWLHLSNNSESPGLIDETVRRIPRIVRITLDLTSVDPGRRTEQIQKLKRMRLDSFGLALKPIKLDDCLLVIE